MLSITFVFAAFLIQMLFFMLVLPESPEYDSAYVWLLKFHWDSFSVPLVWKYLCTCGSFFLVKQTENN